MTRSKKRPPEGFDESAPLTDAEIKRARAQPPKLSEAAVKALLSDEIPEANARILSKEELDALLKSRGRA